MNQKTRIMKKVTREMKKIVVILILFFVVILSSLFIYYSNNLKSVGVGENSFQIEIVKGDTYTSLAKKLKENNLIKSELVYKLYIKLNKPENLQIGSYALNDGMTLQEIIKEFERGSSYNPNIVRLTFPEGINIRKIAKIISENTTNNYDDIINKINDKTYVTKLINDYWFLTDKVLNKEIYYPLEGYLFPSTYEVYKDSTIEEIVKKMLDKTNDVLSYYKNDIEESNFTVHELLSLSSMIELEGKAYEDKLMISSVFHNRIKDKWSLGSDVTTYYAFKIDDFKTNLTTKQLNDCNNGYNTRGNCRIGLPVGPISNSSEDSIYAAINPNHSDYYYFVSDCSFKVYFSKNVNEHNNIIKTIKGAGNWCG